MEEERKCCSKLFCLLAILGGVVIIAGIAYLVVKFCMPDYLEDFDNFDDFDDFDEDEEDDKEAKEEASEE
jgi:hypothetical protein